MIPKIPKRKLLIEDFLNPILLLIFILTSSGLFKLALDILLFYSEADKELISFIDTLWWVSTILVLIGVNILSDLVNLKDFKEEIEYYMDWKLKHFKENFLVLKKISFVFLLLLPLLFFFGENKWIPIMAFLLVLEKNVFWIIPIQKMAERELRKRALKRKVGD